MQHSFVARWLVLVLATCSGLQAQSLKGTEPRAVPLSVELSGVDANGKTTLLTELIVTLEAEQNDAKIVLNGEVVSESFNVVPCEGKSGMCRSAALANLRGLLPGKNVVYATSRNPNGSLNSARMRFANDGQSSNRVSTMSRSSAQALSTFPTASNFLPPAVAFTISPGGFNATSSSPWLTVGTQQTLPTQISCTPSLGYHYAVVVLDRRTLLPTTQLCEVSGTDISALILGATPDDLVIIGTLFGANTDAASSQGLLDTTKIGGTAYNCPANPTLGPCKIHIANGDAVSADVPLGYVAIGVGGAQSGSAYENYYTSPAASRLPFAKGMFVEDVNGNYNFQTSGAVEYEITPNDTNFGGHTSVMLQSLPNNATYQSSTILSPVVGNGYWVLTLNRATLEPVASTTCTNNGSGATQEVWQGCGDFEATNDANQTNATEAFQAITTSLDSVAADQIVIVTTVGTPVYDYGNGAASIAQIQDSIGNPAYYSQFAPALEYFGGVAATTLKLFAPGSAYTLISCLGCGNTLTGHAAVSTTAYAQQNQTGFLHGILRTNLSGLYWPTEASQETVAQHAAGHGADFTIALLEAKQPVEWPELNGTLAGSSPGGMVAAYRYISYLLISQHYIKGAKGPFLDDIHYYFTGGNNAYLNYHFFDPANLTFPDSTSCYLWTDPVPDAAVLPCFTPQDFSAVTAQVSTEIVDLTNVLQFMVSGSVNMKDIVAAGNGSAALALISAAAEIEGSTLAPPASTIVPLNASNIVQLVGGLVNLGLVIGTDGAALTEEGAGLASTSTSIVSDLFTGATAVSGGLGGGTLPGAPIPSPQYTFTTTIGSLASGALQGQVAAGFDATLDRILGNWGSLSTLGPRITDSTDRAFYAPNQAVQNTSVALLGQASQRSMLLALFPTFFSVQYFPAWYGVNGASAADMTTSNSANTWYLVSDNNAPSAWDPIPQYVGRSVPSFAGQPNPWGVGGNALTNYRGYCPCPTTVMDWTIIGGRARNIGQTNESIPVIDSALANQLFSATGLNLPYDAFVARTGPMASVFHDASSDAAFFGWQPSEISSAALLYLRESHGAGLDATALSPRETLTRLSAPVQGILGESVTVRIAVSAPQGVPTGLISLEDGGSKIATLKLDATGSASFTTAALSLGGHSLTAYYQTSDPYLGSHSDVSLLTIFAAAPDMHLSLSASALSIAAGSTSAPVLLQVTSTAGMAGTVNFTCTGLPAWITCSFSPAQIVMVAGSITATSLTLTGGIGQASFGPQPGILGWLALSASLYLLVQLRRSGRALKHPSLLALLFVVCISSVIGCGTRGPSSDTGTRTVLVNATSASFTRSIPLQVTIH